MTQARRPGDKLHEKKGTFVVANDGTVDHYQRFQYPAWDEQGYQRDFSGWLTSVNKPLMAAGEVSKMFDSYVHDTGGVLMQRNGPICRGMRREFKRLQALLMSTGMITSLVFRLLRLYVMMQNNLDGISRTMTLLC